MAQIDQVTKLVLFDYENFLKRLATAALMWACGLKVILKTKFGFGSIFLCFPEEWTWTKHEPGWSVVVFGTPHLCNKMVVNIWQEKRTHCHDAAGKFGFHVGQINWKRRALVTTEVVEERRSTRGQGPNRDIGASNYSCGPNQIVPFGSGQRSWHSGLLRLHFLNFIFLTVAFDWLLSNLIAQLTLIPPKQPWKKQTTYAPAWPG